VALLTELQTLIRRAAIVGVAMTGQFSLGPKGPLYGGAPLLERGPGDGALKVP
jgi:hypothetical protein